jgi:hypothetical protein
VGDGQESVQRHVTVTVVWSCADVYVSFFFEEEEEEKREFVAG